MIKISHLAVDSTESL